MREILVSKLNQGQRIDKYVKKYFSNAPLNFIYKLFRIKDVKVNGVRVKRDYILQENDLIQIYVNEQQIEDFNKTKVLQLIDPSLKIIYEDENIMIIAKPRGLLVHGNEKEKSKTLTNMVLNYLYSKGEYNPRDVFIPSPVHRLDRFTSGIIIFAKNMESLHILEDIFKNKQEIKKSYLSLVKGKLTSSGKIDAPIYKDEKKKIVSIRSVELGGKPSLTYYSIKKQFNNCTLVDIDLITGRTHQIRIHFSYINHPVLGDNKYGDFALNKLFEEKYHYHNQFLHAYKIEFKSIPGILNYLSNKTFECPLFDKEREIIQNLEKEGGI